MNPPESPQKLEVSAAVVKTEESYPEFTPPEGFEVPEGTKDGEEFQSVATLKEKDGKLCLLSLDGAEFSESDEEEPEKDDGVVEEESTPGSGQEDGGYAAFQEEISGHQRKMKGQ